MATDQAEEPSGPHTQCGRKPVPATPSGPAASWLTEEAIPGGANMEGWPSQGGMRVKVNAVHRHPVVTMFVLVYALTWVVWLPRAAGEDLGLLGRGWTWAPAVAALAAAALTGGKRAVREWAARLVRWRVRWFWYVIVILGPAAFSLLVAGCYALIGGSFTRALPWLKSVRSHLETHWRNDDRP